MYTHTSVYSIIALINFKVIQIPDHVMHYALKQQFIGLHNFLIEEPLSSR